MTSVIVPVLDGAAVLPRTLPALQALEGVAEVIVVDDGSTDGTAVLLASAEGIRTVTLSENRGRAAARNAGVAAASGDVLVFFDADVEPPPSAARALASAALGTGAVASVARLAPVPDRPDEPFQDYVCHHPRGPARDAAPGDRIDWRFFLSGCCAVRRTAFEAAGGFPEDVPYGEDVALGRRLAAAHPDGLRLADATVRLHDLGDLARALRYARQFGQAVIAIGSQRHDQPLGQWTRGPIRAVARPAARGLRAVVARLPAGRVRRKAVRYLLASTALAAARRA